jgi:hypothetical protein
MTDVSSRRPDISEGLLHLTKAKGTKPAFDVLQQILTSGKINGSGRAGFVKGQHKAVCFSEAPMSAIPHLIAKCKERSSNKPKESYSTYGLAISKTSIYELGGRPVIYLPDTEAEWIPANEKWRQVRFEPPKVDWSHEREWRLPGSLDLLKVKGLYVLVSTSTEAKAIQSLDWPAKHLLRGVLPMEHLNRFL